MGEHTAGTCRLRRELLGRGCYHEILSDLVKSVDPLSSALTWQGAGGSCGVAGRN